MSLIQTKNQCIERIIRDKNGKLVRATFCVYEIGGRIKARLVDFKFIEELSGKVFKLLTKASKSHSDIKNCFNLALKTHYSLLITLYFIGSKPRAPTTH
jgi:hypothetical protein